MSSRSPSLIALCGRGLLLLLLAAALGTRAQTTATVDDLVAYLNGLDSFAAAFTQTRYDEDGAVLEVAEGSCRIQRPGRFRWTYAEPYPQEIVSDGVTLWIHDPDLEQVTRTTVDSAGQGSPAALLGRESDVAAHYVVTPREDADGRTWFHLQPRAASSDFSAIELAFADGEVGAMRLTDNLGQVTVLEFRDIERNRALEAAQFDFVPPPGTDVVEGGMP